MVWTINIERKDYSLQEKVRYATILQQRKLSIEAIAHKMRYSRCMVRTFLNVNKLPEKYQKLLWQNVKGISIAHINDLASFFNGNIATALKHLDLSLERKLNQNEFEAYLNPELEKIERKRVESAKKAVGKITTELKEPKTPEELEKAAEALKREAKRKREAKLSPEEKVKREAEKQRKKEEQKRKREEKKRREEERLRKKLREEEKAKLLADEEFKKKAAEEMEKEKKRKEREKAKEKIEVDIKELVVDALKAVDEAVSKLPKLEKVDVKKRGLVINLMTHKAVLGFLEKGDLSCPDCGSGGTLVWSCCGTPIKKAKNKLSVR